MYSPLKQKSGLTLVELVITLALVGVLIGLGVQGVINYDNSARYEETRAKLEAIRVAILGDNTVDGENHRTHFGYVGDMGRLPTSLSDLVTQGTQGTWAFDNYGVGAGWKGPYITSDFSASQAIDKDAWGTSLVYTTASPASIKSLGADRATGGSSFAKDLEVTIVDSQYKGTAKGVLASGEMRLASKTVALHFPANGILTNSSTATNSDGVFTFAGVPFGIRALELTDPDLGYRRFVMDAGTVIVPPKLIDAKGKVGLSYVAASASTASYELSFQVNSTYPSTVTLKYLTASYSQNIYLKTIRFPGGQSQTVPNVASGTRVRITDTLSLSGNSTSNTIYLDFASTSNGTGVPDLSDTLFQIAFEWDGNARMDSVSFTTN